jgi:hypothetical protein
MLSYSTEPKRLVSTFLAYRNDVDIYTEDNEDDKEFYRVLFNRLLKPEIKIQDITPLGSKENVISLCKTEPENGRRKIFIIDGDVAIIHGDIVSLPNLYVLDSYCIENFLIAKDSICQFVYLNCGIKAIAEIEATLEYENWLSSYSESLMELFIHFAIANKLGSFFTLYNANKYHKKVDSKLIFDKTAVDVDIDQLRNEILANHSPTSYNEEYQRLKAKWPTTIEHMLKIVSGKDYLIPILLIKTQEFKRSKAMPSLEEVKISLVQYCKLEGLTPLKELIEGPDEQE